MNASATIRHSGTLRRLVGEARGVLSAAGSQIATHGRFHVSLTPRSILLLVAVICFLLAAFSVAVGSVGLVPLGLAAFAAAFLLDGGGFKLRR